MNPENTISGDLKELIIARIDVMPSGYKLSIGNKGTFSKEDLIKHVKEGDSIGREIIETQLEFIRSLTSGEFMKVLNG